jgi:hypothetical protein
MTPAATMTGLADLLARRLAAASGVVRLHEGDTDWQ